jgi:hypothetical protein
MIFKNIEYIDPNNQLIENIKIDEIIKQESNFKNQQHSQNIILKQTSSTQNKSIFTKSENNIKSSSANNYIEENRNLDKAYIKEHIDNNNDLNSIVNMDTLPMNNTYKSTIKLNKHEIEPLKYDLLATVKNKLHINHEKV